MRSGESGHGRETGRQPCMWDLTPYSGDVAGSMVDTGVKSCTREGRKSRHLDLGFRWNLVYLI